MNNTRILVICAIAIAINVVVGTTVSYLHIPLLFLDSIGTIFIAATCKMRWGILVGALTNIIMCMLTGWIAFPFIIVSIAIAIVVNLMARKNFDIKQAVLTGIVLGIVCAIIGTPIRLALFGGLSGSGTDFVIVVLKSSGKTMVQSTFFGALAANILDKIVSCLLAAIVLKSVGKNLGV